MNKSTGKIAVLVASAILIVSGIAVGVILGTKSSKDESESFVFNGNKARVVVEAGTSVQCPDQVDSSFSFTLDVPVGNVSVDIPVTQDSTLCTLVEVSADGKFISPMARSYNGWDWESTAGKYAGELDIDCGQGTCNISLPPLPEGASYELTSFEEPSYSRLELAARFLEQATFGPKKDEILSFSSASNLELADWIQEQQEDVSPMSHRALFRKHLNARSEVNGPLGPVTQPCQRGTRYRWTAFSVKDTDKTLSIETRTGTGGEKKVLSVDGYIRTVMDSPAAIFRNDRLQPYDWQDGQYRICFIFEEEQEGNSVVIVETSEFGCVPIIFSIVRSGSLEPEYYSNPPIVFDRDIGVEPNILIDIPPSGARPIDAVYFEEFEPQRRELIVSQNIADSVCTQVDPRSNEPAFAVYDDEIWIHDPRYQIFENSLDSPLADGGGGIQNTFGTFDSDYSTMCSNVPRTFLNEDTCYLSTEPSACRYKVGFEYEEPNDDVTFVVDDIAIRAIYNVTGAGSPGTEYIYAIDGLDITRDSTAVSPCQVGSVSRWVPVTCSSENQGIAVVTARLMSGLIDYFAGEDENPNMVDVYHVEDLEFACNNADLTKVGFEVPADFESGDQRCWRNVHPDHLNVYSFTPWTVSHPGNLNGRNPIKEFAEAGETKLLFPDWHVLSRWNSNKNQFFGPIRLGDRVPYYALPSNLRTPELAEALGVTLQALEVENSASIGTVVCGSPYEISNDPFEGGSVGRGSFDVFSERFGTTPERVLFQQRQTAWTMAVLNDPGQLRQRVAWALSQILVISPDDSAFGVQFTEAFLVYYDIFIRHAFGNYRDVLKEVSYSRLMAEMLTYYNGRSSAYVWEEEGNVEFADENYAREIMQLFTVGLLRLNEDGTEIVNDEGAPEKVYTNDDIEEYARVWTGFVGQMLRGNAESSYENPIDPMYIEAEFRDRFPKMGLNGVYIGDGYPLCSDLPQRHFLSKGAKYRLVGKVPIPEVHNSPDAWKEDGENVGLSLGNGSGLFKALCVDEGSGGCSFPVTVTLSSSLDCSGIECSIDTVRLVEVAGLFYEYIRPACVQQSFYNDGKVLARRYEETNIVCGDPRLEVAVAASCQGEYDDWEWNEFFFGERVSFDTANRRGGGATCTASDSPNCDDAVIGTRCYDNGYYWTGGSCDLGVLISETGKIAVAHLPQGLDPTVVDSSVRAGVPKTYFRAEWMGSFENIVDSCSSNPLCQQIGDACGCRVTVEDSQVFSSVPSRDDLLSQLSIGAFEPSFPPQRTLGGIDVYTTDEGLSSQSIFGVVDEYGVRKYFLNTISNVLVGGTDIGFRNPPHFVSLVDAEPRDAHYETDAALDHYFYHPNTAPFLAIRFAQRFGISNPSPRYIKAIAMAFKTGSFELSDSGGTRTFGSGAYGDLAATFAAVLLDREARSEVLDADPTHGALKEPLIKLLGLMRSLNFELKEDEPWVEFGLRLKARIGQAAHRIPTVFSFFLPEYQPSGPVAQGSLVAPEAQLLTGPRIIDSLNGIFSMIRYGLSSCYGGFGREEGGRNNPECNEIASPNYDGPVNSGELTYSISGSPAQIVDELALLLTSGRLSPENRQRIEEAISAEPETEAIKTAQLLIASTPEFHATNLVRKSGEERPVDPSPQPSSKPYKAVVYLLLAGGADTYNVLAPHSCPQTNSNGQTLLEQYYNERTSIAITDAERSLTIDATGQPCDQFVIHEDLPSVERLYSRGDLAFFANTGALDVPVTKEDYERLTQTELFAHNTMQREAQRVDPWDLAPGTGILGRMADVLANKGFTPQPITVEDASIATVGVPGQAIPPIIVSPDGLNEFDLKAEEEEMDVADYVFDLNDGTTLHSSIFAETWSDKLQKAIGDAEKLKSSLDQVELTQEYAEGDYTLAKVETVSKLILTQEERGTDRDVIFLEVGGWDHHEQLKNNLSLDLQNLNRVIDTFQKEMEAQNMWDQVTLVVASEFARTLTANSGEGSDHAWGGNYMVMGGSVDGGKIHGQYPADITPSGPLNVGRGRLIPTSSWESLLNPVLEWMGVDSETELDYCMPNRIKTGTKLYSQSEVFESSRRLRSERAK